MAYNTVTVEAPDRCPRCQAHAVVLQFKFGSTWGDHYALGDTLRWGGNDIGQPGLPLVNVGAFLEGCAGCRRDNDDATQVNPWLLRVEHDVLRWARPATTDEYSSMIEGVDYRGWYVPVSS